MKKLTLSLALLACTNFAFANGHSVHWSYGGSEGAEYWGSLSPDYATCNTGKNQSPIDISNTLEAETPTINFTYNAIGNEVVNNGHTIQVNALEGSSIVLQGHRYALKQFHFHAPSENTVDGKFYPFEAHLVHQDDKGNLAVVAIFFKEGDESSLLKEIWSLMPKKADVKVTLPNSVNPLYLLPDSTDYYRFNGSLTTPPCTEGVTWLVMKQPITASKAQIKQFQKVMGHPNNRPVQPVNARPVLN